MEPVNAKCFDPDTGLPLDGTHSLPISEVFRGCGKGVFAVAIIPGWIYGLATSNPLVLLAVGALWLVGFMFYGKSFGQSEDSNDSELFAHHDNHDSGLFDHFDYYDPHHFDWCEDTGNPSDPFSGSYMDDDI